LLRLALHVRVHLRAHVVDEALPDARGVPALRQAEDGVEQCETQQQQRHRQHDIGVAGRRRVLADALVDDVPEDERVRDGDQCIDHDQDEEDREVALVRRGEAPDATDRPRRELLADDRRVARERPHHLHGTSRSHRS
jgi:hypothetical protein